MLVYHSLWAAKLASRNQKQVGILQRWLHDNANEFVSERRIVNCNLFDTWSRRLLHFQPIPTYMYIQSVCHKCRIKTKQNKTPVQLHYSRVFRWCLALYFLHSISRCFPFDAKLSQVNSKAFFKECVHSLASAWKWNRSQGDTLSSVIFLLIIISWNCSPQSMKW